MTQALEQKRPALREANAARLAALEALICAEQASFREIAKWGTEVSQLPEEQRVREAPAVIDAYREWAQRVEPVVQQIRWMKQLGQWLAGASELLFAVGEAKLYAQPERLLRAMTQLDEGKGRPLEQVMDELRRRDVR